MATVRSLACIAFRPEALDVHNLRTAISEESVLVYKTWKAPLEILITKPFIWSCIKLKVSKFPVHNDGQLWKYAYLHVVYICCICIALNIKIFSRPMYKLSAASCCVHWLYCCLICNNSGVQIICVVFFSNLKVNIVLELTL